MIQTLRYAFVALLLLALPTIMKAQPLLPGQILVLGFNSDETYPNQRWAFMTLVDLNPGTNINFTDAGYDGSTGNFRTGGTNDSHMSWTTPGAVTRGTIIYATNNTVNGSTSGVTGNLGGTVGFSTAGDQLIVYQGTMGTAVGATFIYAYNNGQASAYLNNGLWITSGAISVDQQSYIPPGLNSNTSLALTSNVGNASSGPGTVGTPNYGFDNMRYAGSLSGSPVTIRSNVANPANWIGDNATPYNFSAGGAYPSNTFTVLPVNLLYFNAQQQAGETVKVSWGTAMESNNDHFTIERSGDGIHFSAIAQLPGKGDYNQPTDYAYTDRQFVPGKNYYRLSQTDRDGTQKILGIKMVTVEAMGLRYGPNPAMDAVNVSFNRGVWSEIRVYNSSDQLLQTIPVSETTSSLKVNLVNYGPGAYYLAFISRKGDKNRVEKILKRD